MAALITKRSAPEFGTPFRASLADWEATEGATLMTELLGDPSLQSPDPVAFARTLAVRAAEITRADYVCVCTFDVVGSFKVIAEQGRKDQRLLTYIDRRAPSLAASPAGGDEPSVHTMTGADQETDHLISYAMGVSAPRNRGHVYLAVFRATPRQDEMTGFAPLELERLRWLTAAAVPLLDQANRVWSAKNALRAECGAIAPTSYAAIAHQLLFANLSKVVHGYLSEIQAAITAASALPLGSEQEEYIGRVRDAANLLERFTSRPHLEAEADAPLPTELSGPLHPGRFLRVCVDRFKRRTCHVQVEAIASGEPLDTLPVVRVDPVHLEMVVQSLIGLLASLTFCDDELLLDAGIEPSHVWFRLSHAGPLADPEGLHRQAAMVESLAQAVGGMVAVTTTTTGSAYITLSVPRVDGPSTQAAPAEPEEVEV